MHVYGEATSTNAQNPALIHYMPLWHENTHSINIEAKSIEEKENHFGVIKIIQYDILSIFTTQSNTSRQISAFIQIFLVRVRFIF